MVTGFDYWLYIISHVKTSCLVSNRIGEKFGVPQKMGNLSGTGAAETSRKGKAFSPGDCAFRQLLQSTRPRTLLFDKEQEFVIGGYTEPDGSRKHFGALLVGFYEAENLKFAGRVGTGFSEKLLRSLFDDLQNIRVESCPFSNLAHPDATVGTSPHGVSPT
jgi:ATP dependent DNA ligase C terminal region